MEVSPGDLFVRCCKMWRCLSWHVKGYGAILALVFISFIVGLNLGLHGLLTTVQEDLAYITRGSNARNHLAQEQTHSQHPIVTITQPTIPTLDEPRTVISPVQVVQPEPKAEPIPSNTVPETVTVVAGPVTMNIPTLEERIAEVNMLVDKYAAELYTEISSRIPSIAADHSKVDVPIVLLTCNRPALLRQTIDSLLTVRGVRKENVVVSQDGAMQEVADIANAAGLKLIQNQSGLRLRGGAATDGAARIAQHYRYSLTSAFELFKSAPAVIVIEDDLLFSPDLYEYLQSTAPILDADPTAFVVSAWSDNGFKDKVRDPYALRRTDYFPGLGWLLTRRLYEEELEPKWPTSHWDHWLRAPETSLGRDIIYPQVPRTYHNGIKGTFMNLETHNRYFRDIGYNTDAGVTWPPQPPRGEGDGAVSVAGIGNAAFMRGHHQVDQHRIEQMIKRCKHVTAVTDLMVLKGEIICLWLSVSTDCERQPVAFAPIAGFFGIWHEHRRGNHQGLHEFYWEGNYLLLLNVFDEDRRKPGKTKEKATFKHLMPPDLRPLQRTDQFDKTLLTEYKRRNLNIKTTKAATAGLSCDAVCRANGQQCKAEYLPLINTCAALESAFSCNGCRASFGPEQPAYVDPRADAQFGPGQCLHNTGSAPSTCEASHPSTLRLCPCV